MSSTLSPQSFIRSNSACEISFNDGSLNILPTSGLMLFKDLMMLVVQLVAKQNLSLFQQLSRIFLYQKTLQHISVGHLVLSFWVAHNHNSVTIWRYDSLKQAMPGLNQAFHDLLVFDYILLHHRLQSSAHLACFQTCS